MSSDLPPIPNDSRRWFHVILSTYGSWLRGDPRGFRTRDHRQHVDGDYKAPPPVGMYAELERRSRESLKQPPVSFEADLRPVVGAALHERLSGLGAWVLCLAVGGQHAHLLVKLPADRAHTWSGLAKKHAAFVLRANGRRGKLWAARSLAKPIADRDHQLRTFRYILAHAEQGAWVGEWKTPVPLTGEESPPDD